MQTSTFNFGIFVSILDRWKKCLVSGVTPLHTFLEMLIKTSFHLVCKMLNKLIYFSITSSIYSFWDWKQFFNSSLKTVPLSHILKTFTLGLEMEMIVMPSKLCRNTIFIYVLHFLGIMLPQPPLGSAVNCLDIRLIWRLV